MHKLAIVIPAFRKKYFAGSIGSVIRQTDKRFNLYIGDDFSPEDLRSVIEENEAGINIIYHRFDENLGSVSLTKHWERCIGMVGGEEYIWLFSDDDLMPDDAVERFYRYSGMFPDNNIFRFNLQFINEKGEIIRSVVPHPDFEKGVDFLKRRLNFSTISAACEYIFRRSTFNNGNGFVEFPLAWCSDDATWASIAGGKDIVTIKGTPISMRMSSGFNISSDTSLNGVKYRSVLMFIEWLYEQYPGVFKEDLYFRYMQSQMNYLSPGLFQRLISWKKLYHFLGFSKSVSLLVNRSSFYRLMARIE